MSKISGGPTAADTQHALHPWSPHRIHHAFTTGTVSRNLYIVLSIAFAIRLAIALMPAAWLDGFICDDAYYYFSIANTMQGGIFPSADGGITQTNGFHPLWLALISPFWIFGGGWLPIRLTMITAALLDTVAGFMLFRLTNKLYGVRVAMILAGVYLFNPMSIIQTMSGLETPLNSLLIVLLLAVVYDR
ncbi:MAG: hypothetical protein WC455_12295 [Dehalococcoidia bacterium]|jgi:hypothetical protein